MGALKQRGGRSRPQCLQLDRVRIWSSDGAVTHARCDIFEELLQVTVIFCLPSVSRC